LLINEIPGEERMNLFNRLVEFISQTINAYPDLLLPFLLLFIEILVKTTAYRFIAEDFWDSINQIGLDFGLISISFLALSTTDPHSVFSQYHSNVAFAGIVWVMVFLGIFVLIAVLYKKHKVLPGESGKEIREKAICIGLSWLIGFILLFQSIALL
jgi:hypothetical protein